MSVEIRALEATPPIPMAKPGLTPDLLAAIQNAARDAADQAAASAHRIASQLAAQTLADVEKRLQGIEKPMAQIMAIEIDGIVQKLDAPISEQSARVLSEMIINAKLGLNTMLVGPSGCGKSTLCKMLARALGVDFSAVSWSEAMSETPVLFARQFHDKVLEAPFSRMFRDGGVFLHDEFDHANPNAAGKVNMALANGHLYNEVLMQEYARSEKFACVAACNTFGKGADDIYTAANRLSASTLDRFVPLAVTYDAEFERAACPDETLYRLLSDARGKLAELRSSELITTRAFQTGYMRLKAGISGTDVLRALTLSWPVETVKACKLDKWPKDTRKSSKSEDAPKITAQSETLPGQSDNADTKIAENEKRIAELKAKLAGAKGGNS